MRSVSTSRSCVSWAGNLSDFEARALNLEGHSVHFVAEFDEVTTYRLHLVTNLLDVAFVLLVVPRQRKYLAGEFNNLFQHGRAEG